MEKWQPQSLEQVTVSRRELASLVTIMVNAVADADVVSAFDDRHKVDAFYRIRAKLAYAAEQNPPGVTVPSMTLTWAK